MDFFFESIKDPVRARAGVATVIDAAPRPRSSARRSACARSAVGHRCGVVTGAWRAAATARDASAQMVLCASMVVEVLLQPRQATSSEFRACSDLWVNFM